ncbi:type VI secretion system-associated FHA domain protein TagH [Terrarubrum flagellatum]|uniref:type VI secretion system-associated FHA domain protein TagH n=1 Tax=Terrirubrum flagellatum TaxID=2895980 RepID=UPI00314519B3
MPLRLTLENVPSLPDGGPVSYSVSGKRGFDIGRDQYLDWVLPDPNRVVSGKHCEVRYRDGGYWLRDVSTNGTFVNRSERRLQEQHRLRSGDRIEIGHYIINVEVEGDDEAAGEGQDDAPQGEGGLWGSGAGAAPPVDPKGFRAPRASQPLQSGDVLDWAASIPEAAHAAPPPSMTPGPSPYAPLPPAPSPYAPPSVAPPAGDVWGGGGDHSDSPWGAPPPAAPASFAPPPAAAPVAPPPPPPVAAPFVPEAVPPAEPPAGLPRATPPEFAPAASEQRPTSLPPMPQLTPSASVAPAPPPPLTAAPSPPSFAPTGTATGGGEFIRRFAKGARLSEEAIATRDAGALAELLGVLMHIAANNLGQLLVARAESKGAMRSSNQTLIQATDNNPLRFSPTGEDALAIMFGRQTKSYLDAQRAFEQSFLALKAHQVDSFAAIQTAIQKLVADLDPKEIEKALDANKSAGMFTNKKARLWDDFVTRWKMKAGNHESGLFGAFMQYFGDAYDKRKS